MDVRPPSCEWTLQKTVGGKEYEWCSQVSGAPAGKGCDKWVRHPPNECNGTRKRFLNARAQETKKPQGTTAAKHPKSNTRRELQVKTATISAMDYSDSSSDESEDDYPEWLAKGDQSPRIKSMEGPAPPRR